MKNDIQDFDQVKQEGENFYEALDCVNCPYFKEKIYFKSGGLEHLSFRKRGRVRLKQDQYMRFKLLGIVPEILKQSHTLQGKLETKRFEKIRRHNRTDLVFKDVTYYEFIAIVKRNRVKIIVKQVESGEREFWSIIPFWGMNDKTKSRIFHEGFPEED